MSGKWTGEFVGRLHNAGITCKQFSEYAGMHPKYISAILNGKRNPKGAEKRYNETLDQMLRDGYGVPDKPDATIEQTAAAIDRLLGKRG